MSKLVGERIRSIRLKRGQTLERFGEEFSPPAKKSVVSNWELGKNLPNKKRMNRIAEMGGMTISELMEGHYGIDLTKENKRLREALEFYADRKTYHTAIDVNFGGGRVFVIDEDEGKIARDALEGE